MKRYANRVVRHRDVPNGKAYRRVIDSFDICDRRRKLWRATYNAKRYHHWELSDKEVRAFYEK